jgi:hypothetical protein
MDRVQQRRLSFRFDRRRWLGRAAVVALACGLAGATTVGRAPAAPPPGPDLPRLEAGDCVNGIRADGMRDVRVLPCEAPHESQVIGVLDGRFAYPGRPRMAKIAARACNDLAQLRVRHTAYDLVVATLVPRDAAAWNRRKQVICVVQERHGRKLVGDVMVQSPFGS